ncbi:hypothetical protein LA5095_04344 [Roseibium album]|uniref:Uncharacterized protein n=1 Tax=Roseibium album TaxID=311410 RepID=A0A0M7AKI2_9HYPH|nr:hypothetical protein LA5094_04529 [Roseibium album]CTQ75399.1 hypothetical protein LA5096_04359 [Roseibium album]CTQ78441.1 hypothetical protein LA5095_04344 [Roseibium album]
MQVEAFFNFLGISTSEKLPDAPALVAGEGHRTVKMTDQGTQWIIVLSSPD